MSDPPLPPPPPPPPPLPTDLPTVSISDEYTLTEIESIIDPSWDGLINSMRNDQLERFEFLIGRMISKGLNLNSPCGEDYENKTLLEMTLEQEEGGRFLFVKKLIENGASSDFFNEKTGQAMIHIASEYPDLPTFRLLVQNKVDIAMKNSSGLTPLQIIMIKLMKLHSNEEPKKEECKLLKLTNNILECILILIRKIKDSTIFNLPCIENNEELGKSQFVKSILLMKNLTPLQVICSYEVVTAKRIDTEQHQILEKIVDNIIHREGVNPNVTLGKHSLSPLLMAAIRGYYSVVRAFEFCNKTNFKFVNTSKQNVLHLTIKSGYENKVQVYNDESESESHLSILTSLLQSENPNVKNVITKLVNDQDTNGNTPLHYAKHYTNKIWIETLLYHNAKLKHNIKYESNIYPKILEEYMMNQCVDTIGEEMDEEFKIKIKFNLFFDKNGKKIESTSISQASKLIQFNQRIEHYIDTECLKVIINDNSFISLLSHPVLLSFLEISLRSTTLRYIFEFLMYLGLVVCLFINLSQRYGILEPEMHAFPTKNESIYWTIPLLFFIAGQIIYEIYQITILRIIYFKIFSNYYEWMIIILSIISIPHPIEITTNPEFARHLSAVTILMAFTRLIYIFIRLVPYSSIPTFINMFTTVAISYAYILLSYFPFILAFSYAFFLIFGIHEIKLYVTKDQFEQNHSNQIIHNIESEKDDKFFFNIWQALMKTIIMFVGEMEYSSLNFHHWLGYVIYSIFVFVIVIVLMNILNGIAVSDINRIQTEADNTLVITSIDALILSHPKLICEEIEIYPNKKVDNVINSLVPILKSSSSKMYHVVGLSPSNPDKASLKLKISEQILLGILNLVREKQDKKKTHGQMTLMTLAENLRNVKLSVDVLEQKMSTMESKVDQIQDDLKVIKNHIISNGQ